MKKNDLLNKYILYMDKNGQERTAKVIKIIGKTLTVIDCLKERHRIHPNQNKIAGVYTKTKHLAGLKRSEFLEEIEWK